MSTVISAAEYKNTPITSRVSLGAALEYAQRVWPVIPIHTPGPGGLCTCGAMRCNSPGKHPRTFNGVDAATCDHARIREWWIRWPEAGIGIATGKRSGIFVVDVDPRNGGFETLDCLEEEHGEMATLQARTGGDGLHIVYRYPRGATIQSGNNVLGPGIDVKGDGGYIVAPPSLHASGRRYAWLTPTGALTPDVFPMDPPDWLLEALAKTTGRGRPRDGGYATGKPPFALPDAIPEGARNSTLIRAAGAIRRRGAGKTVILGFLREINAKRCQIPLDDRELERIAASAAQYPVGGRA